MRTKQKDAVMKLFYEDKERLASVLNYKLDGYQVLPEKLKELNVEEIKEGENTKSRDLLSESVLLCEDGNYEYALLGLEPHTYEDHTLPVKAMSYDASRYEKQIRDAMRENKEPIYFQKLKEVGDLKPVRTTYLNLTGKPYKGPTRLHEMLKGSPELLKNFQDYEITIIDPYTMSDEEISKFERSNAQLFTMLKYTNKRDRMKIIMSEDQRFQTMNKDTIKAYETITGTKLNVEEEEGDEVNMENWLDMWKREERSIGETAGIRIGKEQGIQEGIQRGVKQGIEQGVQEGIVQGRLKQAMETAHNLRKLGMSDEAIADSVGYDVSEVKNWK